MMLLKVTDLSLGYEGKSILSHLNFSIEKGDYIGIVGENGSGKSTLIKTLLGFKKPLSGKITFPDESVKKKIGYLSQQIGAQKDFPASVKEVVLSGCLTTGKWSPFYTKEQKETAKKNMNLLGICDLARRPFFELSGGQKQRVLLARALCATDSLLVLDEPVSGLDPSITEQLYETLKMINDSGVTVVMVSHDVHSTLNYANKILHIDYEKSFFGTVDEYRKNIMEQTKGEDNG